MKLENLPLKLVLHGLLCFALTCLLVLPLSWFFARSATIDIGEICSSSDRLFISEQTGEHHIRTEKALEVIEYMKLQPTLPVLEQVKASIVRNCAVGASAIKIVESDMLRSYILEKDFVHQETKEREEYLRRKRLQCSPFLFVVFLAALVLLIFSWQKSRLPAGNRNELVVRGASKKEETDIKSSFQLGILGMSALFFLLALITVLLLLAEVHLVPLQMLESMITHDTPNTSTMSCLDGLFNWLVTLSGIAVAFSTYQAIALERNIRVLE